MILVEISPTVRAEPLLNIKRIFGMVRQSNIGKSNDSNESATFDGLFLWLLDHFTCSHQFKRAQVRVSNVCFLLLGPQLLQGGIGFVSTILSLFVINVAR